MDSEPILSSIPQEVTLDKRSKLISKQKCFKRILSEKDKSHAKKSQHKKMLVFQHDRSPFLSKRQEKKEAQNVPQLKPQKQREGSHPRETDSFGPEIKTSLLPP